MTNRDKLIAALDAYFYAENEAGDVGFYATEGERPHPTKRIIDGDIDLGEIVDLLIKEAGL